MYKHDANSDDDGPGAAAALHKAATLGWARTPRGDEVAALAAAGEGGKGESAAASGEDGRASCPLAGDCEAVLVARSSGIASSRA